MPPARYRCNSCNVAFVGHNPVASFMPYCPNETPWSPFSTSAAEHNVQLLSLATPDPLPVPVVVVPTPAPAPTPTPSAAPSPWASAASRVGSKPPTASPAAARPPAASAPAAAAAAPAHGLPAGQAGIDAQLIEKRIATQNWESGAGFGPSLQVTTPLKWTDAGCRALYLYLKNKYDDQRIPNTRLYFYFGAIGNFGKAGFRITAHTKQRAQVAKAKTGTVLHIEN